MKPFLFGKLTLALLLLGTLSHEAAGQQSLFISKYYFGSLLPVPDPYTYQKPDFQWNMEGKVQAHLNEGINSLAEENYQVAIGELTEAINLDATLWIARYYRGIAHRCVQDLDLAKNDLLAASKLNPQVSEVFLELGVTCLLMENLDQATSHYQRSVRVNPNYALAYYHLGNLALLQQNERLATKNYNACLTADSLFSNAFAKLGLLQMLQNKRKEAFTHLDRALEIDSLNSDALFLRGLNYLDLGDAKSCVKDWDLLVRVNPTNRMYAILRGFAYIELEEYEKAFADFYKLVQQANIEEEKFVGQQTLLDKRIDVFNATYYVTTKLYGIPEESRAELKKGFCLLLIGRLREAIQIFERADPSENSAIPFYLKAIAYEHLGQHNVAYRAYESALVLDPDIFDAHKKRGIYRCELKDWTGARTDFDDMLRINPMARVPYRLRGVANYWLNDFEAAASDFTRFIESDSTDREILKYRASAFQNLNQKVKAADDLKLANDLGEFEFDWAHEAVQLYLEGGDTISALSYLDVIIQVFPRSLKGYTIKTRVLIDQKQWEKAEQTIELGLVLTNNPQYLKNDFAYLYLAKGIARNALGDPAGAIKYFNKSAKADAKNPLVYFHRGHWFAQSGDRKSAISDLKRAADLGHLEAREELRQLNP